MNARLLTFERDTGCPNLGGQTVHSTIDEETKSLTLWKF
jgi:hypothetical protein